MLYGLIAGVLLALLESPVGFSADVIPRAAATAPEDPSQSGAPAIPPSNIDPGIERRPSAVPDPRSAVPPPNVDPEMSVNPETAPPAKEAIKPRKGEEPHDKRPSR